MTTSRQDVAQRFLVAELCHVPRTAGGMHYQVAEHLPALLAAPIVQLQLYKHCSSRGAHQQGGHSGIGLAEDAGHLAVHLLVHLGGGVPAHVHGPYAIGHAVVLHHLPCSPRGSLKVAGRSCRHLCIMQRFATCALSRVADEWQAP